MKEIIVNVQRLAPLVRIDKVKLWRTFIKYDLGGPRACCPRLPSDTAKQDDDAPDVLQKRGLRFAEKAMKIKDT